MNPNLSLYEFINSNLKRFPWSYSNAPATLRAVFDVLVAAHVKSWSGVERWSFDNITVKKIQHFFNTSLFSLRLFTEDVNNNFNKVDKRERFVTSSDDTHEERYGKKVYGASYYKSHTNKGFEFGNTLVTNQIISKSYHDVRFKPYLAEKYLEKTNMDVSDFESKSEIAQNFFLESIIVLVQKGVQKNHIYCTSDSWYISNPLTTLLDKQGVNYVLGCKNNAKISLFGKEYNLDVLQEKIQSWKKYSDPFTKSITYYKIKTYYFLNYGKLRVFMIKRSSNEKIRYYVTNNLKMTIQTFCLLWKDHWGIETFHEYAKKFFGLEDCYSGRKETNIVHWTIVKLLYLFFYHYKRKINKIYPHITMNMLWELYCAEYDYERSIKFHQKREKFILLKRRILKY